MSSINQVLKTRIENAFDLTRDLVHHFDDAALELNLPNLPSNKIAGQIWCIVGARESYIRAITAGEWKGFSCSLKAPRVKQSVLAALNETRKNFSAIDFSTFSEAQIEMAFLLLEHEIQHHGQLIRYVYGNKLAFPKSWNKRYTV